MKEEDNKRFNDAIEFRHSLEAETDRGCALMTVAYLDSQLEHLLRLAFVDDLTLANDLLDQSRPIGSFSSRVDLAYALGIIPPKARRDLHLIRKIRNKFGHTYAPITFDDTAIGAQCRELEYSFHDTAVKPKTRFINATMGLLAVIHAKTSKISRPVPIKDKLTDPATKKALLKHAVQFADEILGKSKVQ